MALLARNGHQLRSDQTTTSRLLLHCESSITPESFVFQNETEPLVAGDFDPDEVWADSYDSSETEARRGFFCTVPQGNVAYCNGRESCIWAGDEMNIAAAFLCDDDTFDGTENPVDVTEDLNNILESEYVALDSADKKTLVVMTTRPAQGFKFYIKTANDTVSTLDVEYFSKTTAAFADVSNDVDGTNVDGKTLKQTGSYTFDSTVDDAFQYHYQGLFLFAYRFTLSAGQADIYRVTANCPFQKCVDVWDGVYRQLVGCHHSDNGENFSYTLDIQVGSYISNPFGCMIGTFNPDEDAIYYVAEEKMAGLSVEMLADRTNTTTSTLTLYYWDGDSWTAASGLNDGTASGGVSHAQTGVISWVPPDDEEKKTMFGVTGYVYKLEFTATTPTATVNTTLKSAAAEGDTAVVVDSIDGIKNGYSISITLDSGGTHDTTVNGNPYYGDTVPLKDPMPSAAAEDKSVTVTTDFLVGADDDYNGYPEAIIIDTVFGVPAPKDVKPFKMPVEYKNRLFFCGYTAGKAGNRVDYTLTDAPDVWNGEETSDDGRQSLYFGGADEITGAVEVFNRYGNSILTVLAVFKKTETYLLVGDGPEDYRIFPLSKSLGVPAPLTLSTAEIGYEMTDEVTRNIVFGCSYAGPIAFDGSTIKLIPGVEKYFDPTDDEYINLDYIDRACGGYDPVHREWHLLLPTGSSTTLNKWIVYSLLKQKWFEIVPTNYPQAIFPVVDKNGGRHLFGFLDTGYMVRLNSGTTWAGDPIVHKVKTGDFFPSGNPWDVTDISYLKTMWKRIDESANLIVRHYADTGDDYTKIDVADLSRGKNRISRYTHNRKFNARTHCIEWEASTEETAKGLQLYIWGYKWDKSREDLESD